MSEKEILKFKYDIRSETGLKKEFAINLDANTLRIINEDPVDLPSWAKLDFCKCPNCSLDPAKNQYCPVAANLSPVMAFFKDSLSYESSEIILDTNDRGIIILRGSLIRTSRSPKASRPERREFLQGFVEFRYHFANHG